MNKNGKNLNGIRNKVESIYLYLSIYLFLTVGTHTLFHRLRPICKLIYLKKNLIPQSETFVDHIL